MIRTFLSDKQKIGLIGELFARKYLVSQGYVIRETNFSARYGEIDIICEKNPKELNFFEVKTLTYNSYNSMKKTDYVPENNVSREKLRKISKTAEIYISQNCLSPEFISINLASVFLVKQPKSAYIRIFEDIFFD